MLVELAKRKDRVTREIKIEIANRRQTSVVDGSTGLRIGVPAESVDSDSSTLRSFRLVPRRAAIAAAKTDNIHHANRTSSKKTYSSDCIGKIHTTLASSLRVTTAQLERLGRKPCYRTVDTISPLQFAEPHWIVLQLKNLVKFKNL